MSSSSKVISGLSFINLTVMVAIALWRPFGVLKQLVDEQRSSKVDILVGEDLEKSN